MDKLKKYTEEMSREEIAAALGVTVGCVQHWLNGTRTPCLKNAIALAALSKNKVPAEAWKR